MTKTNARLFRLGLFAAAAVVFSVYAVSRYDYGWVAGYDFGIFDQVVRAYADFRAPLVSLKGDGFNIWADHFHPLVALWAPFYWLWSDPRMLLIAQSLTVALAVFPVHRFAARRWDGRWAKLFTVGVMAAWPVQCLIDFNVHEVAFAVPLLAWAVEAMDRRGRGSLLAAAGLLTLTREDMGAVVACLGAVYTAGAWRRRRAVRRLGAGPDPTSADGRDLAVGLTLAVA
ncbi:MAG: DUF2079 domain-containing protein, partial [Propionibacteriaceae bacterium]|nr:DUF2079 domain-containing protein [Propionibacteriaceae bacterium]